MLRQFLCLHQPCQPFRRLLHSLGEPRYISESREGRDQQDGLPTQIKRLDMLLFDALLLTGFESTTLRFHETGSLEKLTVTQDDISEQPEKPESIAHKFPQLRDLDLSDVPALDYLPCCTLHVAPI